MSDRKSTDRQSASPTVSDSVQASLRRRVQELIWQLDRVRAQVGPLLRQQKRLEAAISRLSGGLKPLPRGLAGADVPIDRLNGHRLFRRTDR